MNSNEIIQTVNSFPSWNYQFNLKGVLTPVTDENKSRILQRKNYYFDPLVDFLGGSLKGKRVLDIGCNAGFWSLQAIENGCDFVMGIDGRQMNIDQANFVFKAKEIEEQRYKFVAGDVFDLNFQEFGTFDIVFCLGMFHHVSKHMELLEKIAQVNSDLFLLETRLSRLPGAYMEILYESTDPNVNAVDYPLTMVPTKQAVLGMAQQFGYKVAMLCPNSRHKAGEPDYRLGRRRAFLCSKKTDLSSLSVEVESVSLHGGLKDIAVLCAHWLVRYIRRSHLPK